MMIRWGGKARPHRPLWNLVVSIPYPLDMADDTPWKLVCTDAYRQPYCRQATIALACVLTQAWCGAMVCAALQRREARRASQVGAERARSSSAGPACWNSHFQSQRTRASTATLTRDGSRNGGRKGFSCSIGKFGESSRTFTASTDGTGGCNGQEEEPACWELWGLLD